MKKKKNPIKKVEKNKKTGKTELIKNNLDDILHSFGMNFTVHGEKYS